MPSAPTLSILETFWAPLAAAAGLRHGLQDSLTLFLFALARWLPIVVVAPFLGGGRSVVSAIKLGLGAVLAVFMVPLLSARAPSPLPFEGLLWWGIVIREMCVGLMLGFAGSLLFWGAEIGGRFIDTSRGANIAQAFVPQLATQSSPLGNFFYQLFVALFYLLGGHRLFFEAVFDSYRLIPVVSAELALGDVTREFIAGTAGTFVLGLKIVAPAMLVIVLLDLVLGVANRMAPQLDVFFFSLSLRSTLASAVIAISLYYVVRIVTQATQQGHGWLVELIAKMGTTS